MTDYVYKHRNSENHADWQSTLTVEILTYRPKLDGIVSVISNGRDFHMWIRKNDAPQGPTVRLEALPSGTAGLDRLQTLLDSGNGVPIGVNIGDPPNIWVARTVADAPGANLTHQYRHFLGEGGWQNDLENWLNTRRPELKNIWCALSGGRDFHMYVVPGGDDSTATYRLEAIPAAEFVERAHDMLKQGVGKPLGINWSDPPYAWCVIKTN